MNIKNNEINVTIKGTVNDKHGERIEGIIQTSKLAKIAKDWIATESDVYRDRVYLTPVGKDEEYSIAFKDKSKGYDYCIYHRIGLSDEEYEILISDRPELATMDREDIKRVELIDEGFKRAFVVGRPNIFEKFIKDNGYNLSEDTGEMMVLKVTTESGIHTSIYNLFPRLRSSMVIRQIPLDKSDEIMAKSAALFKMMGDYAKSPVVAEIITNDIDGFNSDVLDYLTDNEFEIKIGNYC